MKNWKVILQSNWLFFLLFFLLSIYCIIYFVVPKKSIYQGNEQSFEGIIVDFSIDGDSLKFVVNDREKLQAFYTIKSENEKQELLKSIGYGKKVILNGTLTIPDENVIPDTFNYRRYLYYNDIHYILNVSDIKKIKPENFFYKIKNRIYTYLKNLKYSEYFLAFVLGNTKEYDLTSLRANGISHLFAVSGMHISLFVSVLGYLLKKCKKSKDIIISIFLMFYAFLVSFTPSVLRVVILYFFKLINKKMDSPLSNHKLLFLCFAFLLFWNPFYFMQIGFQYSFLISFAFLYLKQESNYFKSLLKTSFIAFLISFPITAINFFEVNLLGIVLNLIFVPFVSLILYPFCFLVILIPFLSSIYGLFLYIFEQMNIMCSKITLFTIVIPKVPIFLWGIYFLLCSLYLKKNKTKYLWWSILFLFIIKISPYCDFSTSVYFLDIGQGDCTLFLAPNRKEVLLIDTGGKVEYSKALWQERQKKGRQADTLVTFFHSLGITKITNLVLTHGDIDHLGNALALLENIKVDSIILNRNARKALEVQIAQKYSEKIKQDLTSAFFRIDEYTITTDDENDSSLIYRIEAYQTSFLMMGDASQTIEHKIQKLVKPSDIIKLGHHGSKTSSTKSFLQIVNPSYAIISASFNNRYGHPNIETLETLKFLDIPYYETSRYHTICFKITKKKVKFQPMSNIS